MLEREELLNELNNRSDEEKIEFIENTYGIHWHIPEGPCKIWFAKIFTYCNSFEFEKELNFFLFIINILAHLLRVCFNEESTVFLGCTCPCGNKQTVLYYSITRSD